MESQTTNGRGNWMFGAGLILLGGLFLLGNLINIDFEALIPMTIMSGIGMTFVAVYLNNRKDHWWAMIPAYVMFAVSGVIGLSMFNLDGNLVGSYVMFAIAFPFLYTYLRNREHWWALIPSGIMGSIGVGLLVGFAAPLILSAIPALMIIGGIYMLFRNMNGNEQKAVSAPNVQASLPQSPVIEMEPLRTVTGPEADKVRR